MSVEVKLELGHRAGLKVKPTPEGYTHDWTVFVRGADGCNIQYFVEKVVFYLHDSFPKPKRVLKEPPYSVSESGYAGFMMPIEVHFKTKEEPKKVRFEYDLYLRLECNPVSNIRLEKLTFQNPSDDFRLKLFRAGGVGPLTSSITGGASLQTQACPPPQPADDQSSNHPKSVAEKKPRSHFATKEPTKPVPPAPKPSQPFTDIFGAPIRTKSSPDPSTKTKDIGHTSQTKGKIAPNSTSNSSLKEGKTSSRDSHHKLKDAHHSSKESHHVSKDTHHISKDHHTTKEVHHPLKEAYHSSRESHHTPKESHHTSKELHHPLKDSHHSTKEVHHNTIKESHHHISKEAHHISKEAHHSVKEGHRLKDIHHSSKSSQNIVKEIHHTDSSETKPPKSIKLEKESKSSSSKRPLVTDSSSSHGTVEKKKRHISASSENSEKLADYPKTKIKDGKEKAQKHKSKFSNFIKKDKEKSKHKTNSIHAEVKEPPKPKPLSPIPKIVSPVSSSQDSDSEESRKSTCNKAQYSSPASSISEASFDGSRPFASMMMNEIDTAMVSPLASDDELSSPSPKRKLSSDYEMDAPSPEPKVDPRPPPVSEKKHHSHHKSSKHKSKHYHKGNGSMNNDVRSYHSPRDERPGHFTHNRDELMELRRRIMDSEDRQLLQKIVDLIVKTGNYEVSNTTFDFDLCTLDYVTVKKLMLCMMT